MNNFLLVSTLTDKGMNADGQHDPAGTWVVAPSKDPHTQIRIAGELDYLAHIKDGVLVHIYRINDFITERRDAAARENGTTPNVKTSVGVRFSLRVLDEAFESLLIERVNNLNLKGIRGCKRVQA